MKLEHHPDITKVMEMESDVNKFNFIQMLHFKHGHQPNIILIPNLEEKQDFQMPNSAYLHHSEMTDL
jgi:hypothetical protein